MISSWMVFQLYICPSYILEPINREYNYKEWTAYNTGFIKNQLSATNFSSRYNTDP